MAKKTKNKVDVAGTTIRRADKLLVMKRTDGKWDIPKGHVDPGETPYEAAKRETDEETKLPAKISRKRYKDVKSKKGRKYRIFKGKVPSGAEPKLDPHEHTKARWLDKKAAMKRLKVSPHLARAIDNLEHDLQSLGFNQVSESTLSITEEVLIEGRLQDAEKKYGPKIGVDTIKALSKADPSKKNKYLMWAAKQVANREDPDDAISAMKAFDKNVRRLKIKDINHYKTPGEIVAAAKALGYSRGEEQKILRKEADLLYRDGRFIVIHPKTERASVKYGTGTQWCTAAAHSENYFCTYAGFRNVFLYYIIDKTTKDTKYQKMALALHPDMDESEYFDAEDKNMSEQLVKSKLGSASGKIFKAVTDHMGETGQTDASKDIERFKNPTTQKDWDDIANLSDEAGDDIAKIMRKAMKKGSGAPLSFREKMIKRGARGTIEERLKDQAFNQLNQGYWNADELDSLIMKSERWKWKTTDLRIRFYAVVGVKAVPALIKALKDKDKYVRQHAASALAKIGRDAGPAAIPILIKALKDQEGIVRKWAAFALGNIGPKAEKAVPALIQALKDKKEYVRYFSAEALEKIGGKAVPALIKALKDKNGDVRFDAAFALGKIGPKAEKAVPALIEALKDKEGIVREYAAEALGKIGPKAEKAVPALIQALKDKEEHVRGNAVYALEKIGEKAVPALIKALKDKNGDVRRGAAYALEKIGPKAERTPLKTEATTTANIARFMTPIAPPMTRSPLRFQGYEHGGKQPDLCKKCKKRGYICPECIPVKTESDMGRGLSGVLDDLTMQTRIE